MEQPSKKSDFSGLNIDKLVSDINKEKLETEEEVPAPSEEPSQAAQFPAEEADDRVWKTFITYCATNSVLTTKQIQVPIDEDILNTLKACNIGGRTQRTKVNAILRSFIMTYKENLKAYIETKKTLI